MRVINQSYKIITSESDIREIPRVIELAGRTCYKSEGQITETSCYKFCTNMVARGHEAVLEHGYISVKFVVDRGVSHELVRHRLANYCQESTRYCNYSSDKFNSEITVIKPLYLEEGTVPYQIWKESCEKDELAYFKLLDIGLKPEEARAILPTSLKTEVFVTANIREWRHLLKLRTSVAAHPQIREVMLPLLAELKSLIPCLFGDFQEVE